jgi:hypothetical protein
MWSLEAIGIMEDPEEQREFVKPVFVEDRYQVRLPFLDDRRPQSNLLVARHQLRSLQSRLNPEEHEAYERNISGMVERGIVEVETVKDHPGYHMPHHGVWRNGKLRIVYNASSPTPERSLNALLDAGPNLLPLLLDVLLRFRLRPYSAISDVEAAFHQMALHPDDRPFVRFLWGEIVYRFRRVPFGLNCGPAMLHTVVRQHVDNFYKDEEPLRDQIQKSLYCDNLIASFDTEPEAEIFQQEAIRCFAAAGMKLKPDEKPKKILGVLWNAEEDTFAVDTSVVGSPEKMTRRELLRSLARVFDPIGILSAWEIRARVLLQAAFEPGVTWDSDLPSKIADPLRQWLAEAGPTFSIPRCVHADASSTLHVFCDSSLDSYACVAYIVDSQGRSTFLFSKARVAPKKTVRITVPRLELLAATIGCRFAHHFVTMVHRMPYHLWTDAQTVLQWIQKGQQRRDVFVANRLREIAEKSTPEQWRYVPTDLNPADIPSRGATIQSLQANSLYLEGPNFIRRPKDEWPPPPTPSIVFLVPDDPSAETFNQSSLNLDNPPPSTSSVMLPAPDGPLTSSLFHVWPHTVANLDVKREEGSSEEERRQKADFANYTLLHFLRTNAWIRRFVGNLRLKKGGQQLQTGPLSQEELDEALSYAVAVEQQAAYCDEIQSLLQGPRVDSTSSLLLLRPRLAPAQSSPTSMDLPRLIQAVPRTGAPPLPIIPQTSILARMVIEHNHRLLQHQGPEATLAEVRRSVWIPRARSLVKRLVSWCVPCRRFKAPPFRTTEGALQMFRTQLNVPFSTTGCDFLGPLLLKEEGMKVHILLFTCAVIRAVHLELVVNQTVETTHLAFRRFLARRLRLGGSVKMYSDNARTFKKLSTMRFPNHHLEWKTIPERSPQWGGWWERLVKNVKTALRITFRGMRFRQEELEVILYEIESAINCRPLTYVSSSLDDPEVITPEHFLHPTCEPGSMDPAIVNDQKLRGLLLQRQKHLTTFWNRFQREYLASLQTWRHQCGDFRPPVPGQIVLVTGPTPRGQWPLAKILDLIPGSDGVPRAAWIRLRGITTRRLINQLIPLDIEMMKLPTDLKEDRPDQELKTDFQKGSEVLQDRGGAVPQRDPGGTQKDPGRTKKDSAHLSNRGGKDPPPIPPEPMVTSSGRITRPPQRWRPM